MSLQGMLEPAHLYIPGRYSVFTALRDEALPVGRKDNRAEAPTGNGLLPGDCRSPQIHKANLAATDIRAVGINDAYACQCFAVGRKGSGLH